jgi:4-hydroxy-tetrahydrodipicolinate synthase
LRLRECGSHLQKTLRNREVSRSKLDCCSWFLGPNSMERGAAGVMIAPPPSLRTDDQITRYYRQAVEAIGPDVVFVVQDYP